MPEGTDRLIRESGGTLSAEQLILNKMTLRSRQLITSGGKEYVPDDGGNGHSPFAFLLLESLRREHPAGVVTFANLYSGVEWTGAFGDRVLDDEGGDFLFILKEDE